MRVLTKKKPENKSTIPQPNLAYMPGTFATGFERYVWARWGIDIKNKAERIYLAKKSYEFFCQVYFPHYFYLKPATFHRVLTRLLQDTAQEMLAIIGFRGSAKSTHASLAYPIWQAIRAEHHFIILINDTGTQRDISIDNIKTEFEENVLLKADFPLVKPKGRSTLKWTKGELELGNKVFILGRSRGQKIRGLRYHQWRPSLVIGDDLEDLEWVRKKENRDKTERWLKSEVIPAIEETKAKLIIIGNLLHTDALMARLKRHKLMKTLEFPLYNRRTGEITWKAKYPTQEAVDNQKARIEKLSIWLREYLLKIVPEEGAIVTENDIHYYDYRSTIDVIYGRAKNGAAGNDLAISEKAAADFTAIVPGILLREEGRDVLYVLPNIVHKRIDLHATVREAQGVQAILPLGSKIFVEDVGYQKAAIKEMRRKGINAVGIRPINDKRARFETAAIFIKSGQVKFPIEMKAAIEGVLERLREEMIGFGVEEHDDLLDALVYLILGVFGKKQGSAGVGKGDKI